MYWHLSDLAAGILAFAHDAGCVAVYNGTMNLSVAGCVWLGLFIMLMSGFLATASGAEQGKGSLSARTSPTEVSSKGCLSTPLPNCRKHCNFLAAVRYFTDMAAAAVNRIDVPNRLARILAAPDIQRPNGIQISPDDRRLYLIEANGAEGGARMIRAYDLQPDGSVRNMKVHYNFYPGRSADGMSIDSQGNLYASAGLHQRRGTSETLDTKCGVHVISPQGKLIKFIPIPEDTITNNAFGGPDMKTLYVTAGKTLYKVRTEIAGLPR